MTTANPQRQFTLHRKFSTEVRPPPLIRRHERIRSMGCSFEDIAESEEEDIEIPEQPEHGRSPFAVYFQPPFASRRDGSSSQTLSPTLARKLSFRLCRGTSDPVIRRKNSPTSMFSSLSLDRHENINDLLTLPPIPEVRVSSPTSSSDYKDDCEQ